MVAAVAPSLMHIRNFGDVAVIPATATATTIALADTIDVRIGTRSEPRPGKVHIVTSAEALPGRRRSPHDLAKRAGGAACVTRLRIA